ncbi:MAG: hypothetical protein A2V77_03465 [Anaeromyxobacter sp. RBG_16_69_14]|nr:MAG: hypothetical protein A2V77_03465 [Anaeromyxobacter sp. RBG_16_69_14]
MTARLLTVLVLSPLLAACSPSFDSASQVETLRLLALRTEPPEIAQAGADGTAPAPDSGSLEELVAHPAFLTDPARRATVVHIACTPAASDPGGTACTELAALAQPERFLAGADLTAACAAPGVGQAGGITFSGVAACGVAGCEPLSVPLDPADPSSGVALPAPAFALPADFWLGDLPANRPERILGVEVVEVALVLDAQPGDLAPSAPVADGCGALTAFLERFLAAWPANDHVTGLKRLHVRGPDDTDPPNLNPALQGITLAGVPLPSTARPNAQAGLRASFPPDAAALHQPYVRRDATGAAMSSEVESWTISWFATDGEVDELHGAEDAADLWTAPATTPPGGLVRVWAVARDLRGGTAWTTELVTVSP